MKALTKVHPSHLLSVSQENSSHNSTSWLNWISNNGSEAIIVTILVISTIMWGVAHPPFATQPTTRVEIQVLNFAGVQVGSNGIAAGNLTSAFFFTPNGTLQRINSIEASIVYQDGSIANGCRPCSLPGDVFNLRVNGALSRIATQNSTSPVISVVQLSGLKVGSNLLTITVSNPNTSSTGLYLIFSVRLDVDYSAS